MPLLPPVIGATLPVKRIMPSSEPYRFLTDEL
jgi:hypothetical protein